MTLKRQKIISLVFIVLSLILSLQSLIYIVNLNQIVTFLHLALWIWIYLWVVIFLLYDLHFKNPGALARAKFRHESVTHWFSRSVKITISAFWERISHLRKWQEVRQYLNYLLLPGFIFWATVGIFYVSLGQVKLQEIYALLSTIALGLHYWYLKETFFRHKEVVDEDVFVAMSVVKIYGIALVYAASFVLTRRYCLEPHYFVTAVFCFSFLLIYQALFQHNLIKINTIITTIAISAVLGVLAYFVYINWGYNYLTAAIFLAAFYNLFWATYHYHLDKTLTAKAFFEIFLICMLVAFLVLSNTNFKARILDGCMF